MATGSPKEMSQFLEVQKAQAEADNFLWPSLGSTRIFCHTVLIKILLSLYTLCIHLVTHIFIVCCSYSFVFWAFIWYIYLLFEELSIISFGANMVTNSLYSSLFENVFTSTLYLKDIFTEYRVLVWVFIPVHLIIFASKCFSLWVRHQANSSFFEGLLLFSGCF